jgi:hypothetical protein
MILLCLKKIKKICFFFCYEIVRNSHFVVGSIFLFRLATRGFDSIEFNDFIYQNQIFI